MIKTKQKSNILYPVSIFCYFLIEKVFTKMKLKATYTGLVERWRVKKKLRVIWSFRSTRRQRQGFLRRIGELKRVVCTICRKS